MREAVIVAGVRTAVGKSRRGATRNWRPDDMGAIVIRELMHRTEGKLDSTEIDDVIMGCAMPEASQGMNLARIISLNAGLPDYVPAVTVNRFCPSRLQTITDAAQRIIPSGADIHTSARVQTIKLGPNGGVPAA